MSKVIQAIFDSTDMAEFAMIHLKREGIQLESYEVVPARQQTQGEHFNTIVFPYGTNYASNSQAMNPATSYVQPFGGVILASEDNTHAQRTLDDDIHSSNVRMTVKVPDNQAELAEGMIRSCHGYRVRTL